MFKDSAGQDVFVGDILENDWDYRVVVTLDEDGEGCHGELVCEPDHSCANIPYALNGGLGHRKVGSVMMPECPKCLEWVAICMIQPWRCPGSSIKDGRYYIGVIGQKSFRWWDDVVREGEERRKDEIAQFWEINKEHLLSHGFSYPEEISGECPSCRRKSALDLFWEINKENQEITE